MNIKMAKCKNCEGDYPTEEAQEGYLYCEKCEKALKLGRYEWLKRKAILDFPETFEYVVLYYRLKFKGKMPKLNLKKRFKK